MNTTANESRNIFQFKITLKDIRPPIWRRIQVPEQFTFKQLHEAIQMAMGWRSCHLHFFEMHRRFIFNPDEILDFWGPEGSDTDESETYIKDFFTDIKEKAKYEYDFGDSWEHIVELERIEPAKPGEKYPKCVKGRRACPPEDCGGAPGYEELLEALSDPDYPEHKERKEWLKQINYHPFDPAKFSCESVFDHWQD